MNENTTARMLLTTAALAAVAALFAGGANAKPVDIDGGTASVAVTTTPSTQPMTIPYLSNGIGVDASQFSGQPSVGLTGDSALKVDRAVAAANKAYDAYRENTAMAAREALFRISSRRSASPVTRRRRVRPLSRRGSPGTAPRRGLPGPSRFRPRRLRVTASTGRRSGSGPAWRLCWWPASRVSC